MCTQAKRLMCLIPTVLMGLLLATGCQSDSGPVATDASRPERDGPDAQLSTDRTPAPINFGRDGTGTEKRLDRGVPESSSTNPQVENNLRRPTEP